MYKVNEATITLEVQSHSCFYVYNSFMIFIYSIDRDKDRGGTKVVLKEEFMLSSNNGINKLHTVIWKPKSGEVRGILQISHGMVEHIERYDEFARYLVDKGLIVVGNSHIGHGKSVNKESEWGYFAPSQASKIVVDDLYSVTSWMKTQYPDVKYFVLGHSMGSFMIRRYIMTYGNQIDGVIIMGTGSQPNTKLTLGMGVIKAFKLCFGEEHRSKLLNNMMFGNYNKRFSKDRNGKDWLTRDKKIVESYISEPSCSFIFTLNGMETLLSTIKFIQDKKNISKIPKELPMFLVAGEEDPVGNYGDGVRQVYEVYKAYGIKDIELKLYKESRHELINELNRQEVYKDIDSCLMRWLE